MDEKIKICFDKDYRIRVLDPVKSAHAEDLQKECGNFGESKQLDIICISIVYGSFIVEITSFSEKISALVAILEIHANRIDTQKNRVFW